MPSVGGVVQVALLQLQDAPHHEIIVFTQVGNDSKFFFECVDELFEFIFLDRCEWSIATIRQNEAHGLLFLIDLEEVL